MTGSIDHVLQPDGTYKWEVIEHKGESEKTVEACSAPESVIKEQPKKKVSKKKTTNPLSE